MAGKNNETNQQDEISEHTSNAYATQLAAGDSGFFKSRFLIGYGNVASHRTPSLEQYDC